MICLTVNLSTQECLDVLERFSAQDLAIHWHEFSIPREKLREIRQTKISNGGQSLGMKFMKDNVQGLVDHDCVFD